MKRISIAVLMLLLVGGTTQVYAQFLNRLGDAARRAAENAVERNVERKVEEGVDKAFDDDSYQKEEKEQKQTKKSKTESGWTCPSCGTSGNSGKFCNECGTAKPSAEGWTCSACGHKGNKGKFCGECGAKQGGNASGNAGATTETKKPAPKAAEMAYAKSDFVPGDEIIFEDNLVGEQLGEFPSKWDVVQGNAEIAKVNGETVIAMYSEDSWIKPLMKEPLNYLGDVFTVEFDVLSPYTSDEEASYAGYFDFRIQIADEAYQDYNNHQVHFDWLSWPISETNKGQIRTEWITTNDAPSSNYSGDVVLRDNNWHHFAISFNKRALKVYYDGTRIANVPNAKANNGWISFYNYAGRENQYVYLKNVRIAKGAVPLYDRMMSDGKFITYGITFDVGKSVVKPESMGEITRIVQLMNENPTLKFSVEGHTDATGNAASNQKLSEARANAIVAKLVENGIAKDRLTAVGKGQNNPIADNNTDEGRAKNRRVEFVKQ